jgi:3-deoxy-D-manno-octulosonic-acid transferase
MLTTGRYRAGLAQRLGCVPPAVRESAASRPTLWLHAVSVGELIAAASLIRELERALPTHAILISTTTRTGNELAIKRYGAARVFYMPLDFAFIVRRYLNALRPQMLVLLETELWPNLILQASRRSTPIAVVNARISDRSLPRYRTLRPLLTTLLHRISLFCAQSPEDAARLCTIGAPPDRITVTGNLKFDVRATAQSPLAAALRHALIPVSPHFHHENTTQNHGAVLVAGSTLDGEESTVLDVFSALRVAHPDLTLILAPRHPERAQQVAQLIASRGLACVQCSTWNKTTLAPGSVFLLDTIGELAPLYALASVAFIGGSLVNAGGHNPLEPAQFAVPIVMGPSVHNFRAIVDSLRAADAIRIVVQEQLASTIAELLSNRDAAAALGNAAARVFASESGATARTLAALLPLVAQKEPRA